MSEPTKEQLQKSITKIVKANAGNPVGVKALQKELESEYGLGKGSLEKRKDEIKNLLVLAMEEGSEESSDEEVIPRKNTQAAPKADGGRARSGTASTEPVAIEDEEGNDKTAGKSRAGQQADHAGFLKKRGDQGRIKLWRKRHFRLYKKEGVVAYFKSDKENEQLGEISVMGAFLIEKRPDLGPTCFTITMKITARVWILQAPDEATMNTWITACSPLMKETAAVRATGGKKPLKPLPGLPLPFPPKYVQGWTERENSASNLQNGELDWTNLTNGPVPAVALVPGLSAITIDGDNTVVEEVREIALDGHGEGYVNDLPKQLKYTANTVGWTSGDSQLAQVKFQVDEKTQRELLKKLTGKQVTVSTPSTGHGQGEDHGVKQKTRTACHGDEHHHHHGGKGGQGLTFPSETSFSGKLVYDANDDRYALVDAGSNTVHFLDTKDARTIKVVDGSLDKLNAATADAFIAPRLWTKFATQNNKTTGQLTYKLENAFELNTNYVVTLGADEKTASVQGWYSVHNKTSKTFTNATLTTVPTVPKVSADGKVEKEQTTGEVVEEVAKDAAADKAKEKLGGGLMKLGALFGVKTEKAEPPPPKIYRYPVVQKVTLPSYGWAQVAFVHQNVPVVTQHLVTFPTPSYTIKPVVDQAAGADAAANVSTVVRFNNPLNAALPAGKAGVTRRDRSGHGVVAISETVVPRVEGGELVTVGLEKTHGISATRKQTGYNFDAEKHFIIETFEIAVANSRQETVYVTVEESLFRWSFFEIPASKPAHSVTSHPRRISWDVKLNHGEDITIKYTVFYSSFSLDSDYEPRE